MDIAFWSEERFCGTTVHAFAAAEMLAFMYPNLFIELCLPDRKMRRLPAGKVPVRDMRHTHTHCDSRRNQNEMGGLEEQKIRLIDCGSGMEGNTDHVLQRADLIVVNLKQDKESINRFFQTNYGRFSRMFVLLGSYSEYRKPDKEYMKRICRVEPGMLGVLPHSIEFAQAYDNHRIRDFIRKESQNPGCVRNEQFIGELRQISYLLLKCMEKLEWERRKTTEIRRNKIWNR